MVSNNFTVYSIKIVIEIFLDILMFPAWWYSRGFFYCLKNLWIFLKRRQNSLCLLVWIKNVFKPMYGQTDWQGILVSIFVRIVQIIARSFVMFFWLVLSLFIVFFWLLFPPLIVYKIFLQIVALDL